MSNSSTFIVNVYASLQYYTNFVNLHLLFFEEDFIFTILFTVIFLQ